MHHSRQSGGNKWVSQLTAMPGSTWSFQVERTELECSIHYSRRFNRTSSAWGGALHGKLIRTTFPKKKYLNFSFLSFSPHRSITRVLVYFFFKINISPSLILGFRRECTTHRLHYPPNILSILLFFTPGLCTITHLACGQKQEG